MANLNQSYQQLQVEWKKPQRNLKKIGELLEASKVKKMMGNVHLFLTTTQNYLIADYSRQFKLFACRRCSSVIG